MSKKGEILSKKVMKNSDATHPVSSAAYIHYINAYKHTYINIYSCIMFLQFNYILLCNLKLFLVNLIVTNALTAI